MIEFSWAAMFPTKTITVEEENRFGGPASSMSR